MHGTMSITTKGDTPMQLSRGQKVKLSDLTPGTTLELRVGLTLPSGSEADVSCFGVNEQNKLSDDRYAIFYNQKKSPCGSIEQLGGQGEFKERFSVNLNSIPAAINKLVITATIDGAATMNNIVSGSFSILANGQEAGKFVFQGSDFKSEKALIIAEIYQKDVWRVAAVGQGFDGGLEALMVHFGAQVEDNKTQQAGSPPASQAPSGPPSPVNLKKINLDKKIESKPAMISLAKKLDVSLAKVNLSKHQAKVALCLDISGSMGMLYDSGKIQAFAERILVLGCRFDDDGEIDVFLFGEDAHHVDSMNIDNYQGFVNQLLKQYPLEIGTDYAKAMRLIRKFYFPSGNGGEVRNPAKCDLPVYVIFLTDGATEDAQAAEQQTRWSSYEPLFWQFIAIGKTIKDVVTAPKKGFLGLFKGPPPPVSEFKFLETLDNLPGRFVDNANFFSLEDPQAVSDEQLYEFLMTEYPGWLKLVKEKGMIK